MKKWVFILGLLALTSVFAEESDYDCEFQGINEIQIPIYPSTKEKRTFNFKYQVVGSIKPSDVVIIHLPGGPGSSSMNHYEDPKIFNQMVQNGLPAQHPWILIDPRTVGCNRGSENEFPLDSLTSKNLALDVLSIIRKHGLKKYIIHGHSYGSQWATFLSAYAADNSLPSPLAVVLTGVLGKGKEDGSFSIANQTIKEWNLIQDKLPLSVKKLIEDTANEESIDWSTIVNKTVGSGYRVEKGIFSNPELEMLMNAENLAPDQYESFNNFFKTSKKNAGVRDFNSILFEQISCREFSPNDDAFTTFENGKLIVDSSFSECGNIPFDRPYDSSTLQMKTHLYYVSGTSDYAAPYQGARHHFENQHSSHRNFISVPGGSHSRLGSILNLCMDEFWEAVEAQKDLTTIIPKCGAPLELEIMNVK